MSRSNVTTNTSNLNVTIDDFDPLISYSDYSDWSTPDPQDHPDWFNASSSITSEVWHEATYHYTTVQGAQASFNFTGMFHVARSISQLLLFLSHLVSSCPSSSTFCSFLFLFNIKSHLYPSPYTSQSPLNLLSISSQSPLNLLSISSQSPLLSFPLYQYTNITKGSSVWIYGFTSSTPNYTLTIDPSSSQPYTTSLSNGNTTANERALLFSSEELAYTQHEVVLENQSGGLGVDLVVVGFEGGAEGATLANTTLDDRASEIVFTGSWTQQNNDLFYNTTSSYTEGPGNNFQVNFTGSAVYIYGDQVNDHGPFSVYINDTTTPYATHTGRSGCGGGYAKYCEKVHGLAFFANNLPEGQHTLRLENQGPSDGNMTYFDFDYLVYTTPSIYSTQSLASSSCPFTNCTTASTTSSTTSASTSTSSPSTSSSSAGELGMAVGNGALGLMMGAWFLRKLLV
ncbi:hypothetical protein BCR39DRAFT_532216 [Naematelia encephala]|uniref:Uncharacterized protein n=1 Tax=Naematelia encephala TaxID=71784 RepID=A0A1Y2B3K4_9TREE|nr:hypothetical protein BCR39DRAFT_532216 [Naematelia encephala]